jgi:ubiquinone/menaquinone biosynthesis C-methylase UbiE
MWGLGDYERFAERLSPVHDALVAELRPTARQTWLDVATGTGGVALRAARAGARVTAVDLTRNMLDAALAQAISTGLELELMEADACVLPFADETFDVVTSCFGLGFDREEALVVTGKKR